MTIKKIESQIDTAIVNGGHRIQEAAEKVGHAVEEIAVKALHGAQEAAHKANHLAQEVVGKGEPKIGQLVHEDADPPAAPAKAPKK